MKSQHEVSSWIHGFFSMVLFCAVGWAEQDQTGSSDFLYGQFPKGFQFGVATSAFQIEGAWKTDGKIPSIWDTFCYAGKCNSGQNGDVACDSYSNWRRDIEMLKELGVKTYRLSLSWTRLLPLASTGDAYSAKGIEYYQNLIDALIDNNIEPQVTLYHWDLPQRLQDQGGWLNESSVDWFGNYSRFCFETFGSKVKFWITINEPSIIAIHGYATGIMAPGFSDAPGYHPYEVGHNLLKAHARAYRVYNRFFKASQKGKIGISLFASHFVPASDSAEDVAAAKRSMAFELGWFANPVFGNGDYPLAMQKQIGKKSLEAGPVPAGRLPAFREIDKLMLKRSSDFFGLNFYTPKVAKHGFVSQTDSSLPSLFKDIDATHSMDPSWTQTPAGGAADAPWALRELLRTIRQRYSIDLPIYITENGAGDTSGSLEDTWRVHYLRGHINEVLKAIVLDKINVKGYSAWTLMDNFEWMYGYAQKYGLYAVDFESATKIRTAKKSAKAYAEIIREHGFPSPDAHQSKTEL